MRARVYDIMRTFILHFFLARRSKLNSISRFAVFKLLSVLYLKVLFYPGKDKIISHAIFKFKVSAYSYGELLYLLKEIFLSGEYQFDSKNENPRIIDCGANIGMSILYFKMLYPECSILAFEPNPFVFELLSRNIKQNNLSDVQLENSALADKTGTTNFFISDNKGSLLGSVISDRGGKNSLVVNVVRLSDFMNDFTYDLIKMDIEGAEAQVLVDLAENNKVSNVVQYIIEYHHNIPSLTSNLSSFLKPFEMNNFGYSVKTSYAEIGKFQDILIRLYRKNKTS